MKSALWVGVREGFWLGVPVAVVLAGWGAQWPLGLVWGWGAVAVGRAVRWALIGVALREGTGPRAAGLIAVGRQALVAGLALAGPALGLPPLALAGGLLLPTLGRWIWTVRLVRSIG